MTDLIWHTEQRRVDSLVPHTKNPRVMTAEQRKNLEKSIIRFNLVEIPAIDTDSTIIAGHQRLKVMQLLARGHELIDVRVPNRKLTADEREQYMITSNAVTGDWDFEALKDFDIGTLKDIGFDMEKLDLAWADNLTIDDDTAEEDDLEDEQLPTTEPKTKLGDLILLGEHRLIVGDSTDPAVLQRLFGNERASMIYSDPIYNIKVDYDKGIGGNANYGGTVSDNKSLEEYRQFLRKSMLAALAVAHDDVHVFYWSDQTYIGVIQDLYRELGIENKRVCLWIKNSQNPTPDVAFNKAYEPCTYGVRGKPFISDTVTNLNEVMNNELTTGNALLDEIYDLWLAKRLPTSEYEHPTSKPPILHAKAIKRCTKPGDIILDSFSGSASTMIMADSLKRRVYAVEIEPAFCDLAIRRYEKLTGNTAQIIRADEESTTR